MFLYENAGSFEEKIKNGFEGFKQSLENNNVNLFIESVTAIVAAFIQAKGDEDASLNWKFTVGYDMTWSPNIEIYRGATYFHEIETGYYSWDNKTKVLQNGENILQRLDRAYSWSEGSWRHYNYQEYQSLVCFEIFGVPELKGKHIIKTGKECKEKLIAEVKESINAAYKSIKKTLAARDSFDAAKYGFDKEPSDYISWLAKYAPQMLKNNDLMGGNSFYVGINIAKADCSFWSGRLTRITRDGIVAWVGGDSTDDENIIYWQEWTSRKGYRWRSSTAEVTCTIDYDDKQEFSENIYNYLKKLVQDGQLK